MKVEGEKVNFRVPIDYVEKSNLGMRKVPREMKDR